MFKLVSFKTLKGIFYFTQKDQQMHICVYHIISYHPVSMAIAIVSLLQFNGR